MGHKTFAWDDINHIGDWRGPTLSFQAEFEIKTVKTVLSGLSSRRRCFPSALERGPFPPKEWRIHGNGELSGEFGTGRKTKKLIFD